MYVAISAATRVGMVRTILKKTRTIPTTGLFFIRLLEAKIANGMARKCEIQLSYGIGMKQPISLYIECFGTNRMPEHIIIKAIKDRFDLTPEGIIEYLNLKEPIYSKTTNYGHFGRKGFSWENIVQI